MLSAIKKISLRTSLGLIFGGLALATVPILSSRLVSAYRDYRVNIDTVVLVQANKSLFMAAQALRTERGTAIAGLNRRDASHDQLVNERQRARRVQAEAGIEEARQWLSRISRLDLMVLVEEPYRAFVATRAKTDTAIAVTADQREPALSALVGKLGLAAVDALSTAQDELDNLLRQHAAIAPLVEAKRAVVIGRVAYGLSSISITGALARREPWPVPQVIADAEQRGAAAQAWNIGKDIGRNQPAAIQMRAAIKKADEEYLGGKVAAQRDRALTALRAGQLADITDADFSRTEASGVPILGTAATAALEDMLVLAQTVLDNAAAEFAYRGAIFAVVTILTAVGFLIAFRRISVPIQKMTTTMKVLADGNLAVAIPYAERQDEIGEMAAAVQVFKDNAVRARELEAITAETRAMRAQEDERVRVEAEQAAAAAAAELVVGSIGKGLERLASGDLTFRLDHALPPAYEKLRADLNDVQGNLHTLVATIIGRAVGIRSGTAEISQAADDLSRRTEQQAASLEETAAALDQITATVKKTADGANHARDVVTTARGDAERSGEIVQGAVRAMSEIERSAREISQIIGVIDEIAFQTNLLALNAGVEAARAGEAGKGFAVVASEVRALAQRSADAAKEIKGLISASGQQVASGVDLVGQAGQALGRIAAQVADLNAVVVEIAASAKHQATRLDEVNAAVNQMDQVTQQNAAMVEQSTAASHALAQEASELGRLMERFHVGETTTRPTTAPAAHRPTAKPVAALKTFGSRGASAQRKPMPVEEG